jgi:hypothetical protein
MRQSVSKLWDVPLERPVQPRPAEALGGLDERRLGWYRVWPTSRVAGDLKPVLARLLAGPVYPFDRQQARLAGITWWEREQRLQC